MEKREKLLFPAASFLIFCLGIETGGFQFAALKMSQEFQMSGTAMGAMIAAQYVAIMLMPMLFGNLSDRFGKKRIVMIFIAVFAGGCLLIQSAEAVWILITGIFVLGAGYSVCESTLTAAMTDQYREKGSRYVNLTQCCFSVGAVVGPLLTDYLITQRGQDWRSLFILLGVLFVLSFLFFAFIRFRPVKESQAAASQTEVEEEPKGERRRKGKSFGGRIWSLLFLLLVVQMFLYVGMENGIGFYVDSLMTEDLDIAREASGVLSAFWLAMIPSRFLAGILYRFKKVVLIGGFGVAALLLGMTWFLTGAVTAYVLFFCLGFVCGPVWPTLMGVAAEEYPESTGTVTGVLMAAGGFGGAAVPVLLGWCSEMFGTRGSYLMLAVLSAAALILTLFLFGFTGLGRKENKADSR